MRKCYKLKHSIDYTSW